MKSKTVLLLLFAIILLNSCNTGEKNFLERMFDLESRTSKNAPPSTVEDLKKGIAKYMGDVEKTAKSMEKVAVYWRMLALRYMEKGLYGEAYDTALVALRHYPDSSGLYYIAGVSASFLSKTAAAEIGGGRASKSQWLETAKNSFIQATEIDSKNNKALYSLAVLYSFDLDDQEAALETIKKFLEIDSANTDALFVYARALYGTGDLRKAIEVYDKIISSSRISEKRKNAEENKKILMDELYAQ